MKYSWLVAVLFVAACGDGSRQHADLKTREDSISYVIGVNIGKNLRAQSMKLNANQVSAGLRDFLADSTSRVTDQQSEALLASLHGEMMSKQEELRKSVAAKNLAAGQAFLEENKKEKGVVTLPSGLQYIVLKQGTGKKPRADQSVEVKYRGSLIDGTEFDSSDLRGGTATMSLNGIIKGWTEALQLMPVGSKWKVFIPPQLGFGEQGAGEVIPPNMTLIFEIELIAIK